LKNQSELVNDDMNNWTEYLKKATLKIGGSILPLTENNIYENIEFIKNLVKKKV